MTSPTFQDELLQTGDSAAIVSESASAATAALDASLAYCAAKMRLAGPQAVLDCLRSGDGAAHSYFQYALAQQVAGYLADFDAEVAGVYMFDDEATPEDGVFGATPLIPPLHLIVRVARKTEAFHSLVSALDRALATGYASRAGLPGASHLLDVQAVDAADVSGNRGYGAMLNSLHHRPLKIWER